MISSKLVMVRGKSGVSEEWGEFQFLALPSPGDRIIVSREEIENYGTVLAVHHYPSVCGSNEEPRAEIVAKWTGEMPKLR